MKNFVSLTIVSFLSMLAFACKSRHFYLNQKSGTIHYPLDVNDVSVLYPNAGVPYYWDARENPETGAKGAKTLEETVLGFSPDLKLNRVEQRLRSLEQKGFWPRLVKTIDNPNGFLSEGDFQNIMNVVPSKADQSPNRTKVENFSFLQFVKNLFFLPQRKDAYPAGPMWQVSFFSQQWQTGEDRPLNKLDIVSSDMREAQRWRIVSMRFDPCPHGYKSGKTLTEMGGEKILASETFPDKICHPEIRLVAQPIMGQTGAESLAGSLLPDSDGVVRDLSNKFVTSTRDFGTPNTASKGWYFADYAIHLFYSLDSTETARQFAIALSDIAEKHKDLCPTQLLSLGVHPCLARQFLAQTDKLTLESAVKNYLDSENQKDESFLGEIRKKFTDWRSLNFANDNINTFKNYITKPERVALMLSTNGGDPWLFYFLKRNSESSLESIKIPALAIDDQNSQGSQQMRYYGTGKLQIVPIGAAVKEVNGNSYKPRLFPRPNPNFDSLDAFLRTNGVNQSAQEYQITLSSAEDLRGLKNVQISKERHADLLQLTDRIQNPRFNDEFSVDCGSCHLSLPKRHENSRLHDETALMTSQVESQNDPVKSWQKFFASIDVTNPKLAQKLNRVKQINNFAFRSIRNGRMISAIDLQFIDKGRKNDNHFAFNQFSIYRDRPKVSERVENESELSAALSNRWFLGLKEEDRPQCDEVTLNLCMKSLPAGRTHWLRGEILSRYCQNPMREICAQN